MLSKSCTTSYTGLFQRSVEKIFWYNTAHLPCPEKRRNIQYYVELKRILLFESGQEKLPSWFIKTYFVHLDLI